MTRIETTVTVGEDRRILLELPAAVEPGEHRLVVLVLDEEAPMESEPTNQPLVREGNVLVFAGERAGDVETALADLREERMQKLLQDEEG